MLNEDDEIEIYISEEVFLDLKKESEITLKKTDLPYEIIYEDENLLLINKPSGLLVHGGNEESTHTLTKDVLNYLYYKNEYQPEDTFKPVLIHRLDRNTSGLIMFAKNYLSLVEMQKILNDKDALKKTYLVLIKGHLKKNGTISINVVKNSNENKMYVDNATYSKEAVTEFKTIEKFKDTSLVEATLLTGRTHQIRVTLSYLKNPIVGDQKYGDFSFNKIFNEKFNLKYQFLHSYKLKFKKIKGHLSYLSNLEFIASLPSEKEKIIRDLRTIR